ncbi:CCDC90 family protein [Rickettsiales bacterium]|nr:CCDC90 family protein [Rickettsiales bacterium]
MFAVDTLEYSEEFEKVKFTKAQSRALASSIKKAQEESIGNLVTKNELKLTETALRNEIQSVRAELKTEIQSVRSELKTEIQSLRAELKTEIQSVKIEMQSELNKAMLKLIIAIPAIMTAINFFIK